MVVSEIDGEEQPLPILTFFGPLMLPYYRPKWLFTFGWLLKGRESCSQFAFFEESVLQLCLRNML